MKVDYLENLSFPVGLLAQDSLSGIAEMVKEVFTRTRVDGAERDKLSYWQLIFAEQGEWLLLSRRVSAARAVAVAQGYLVSGTAGVSSQSSRICRASTEELTVIRHGQDMWL